MGWNPNDSIVKVENAPTDKPPAKPPRKSRLRGKIKMQPAGNIQGMVSLRKVQRQTDGTISSWADEMSQDHEVGQLSGMERHVISCYESGLIDDADLDALL